MIDGMWMQRRQPAGRGRLGIAVAFAIGFLVLPLGRPLMFGPLGVFAVVGLAGFASILFRPGWGGFVAAAAGLTAFTAVAAALAGFSGLHFLALAFVLVALAAGACGGSIVNTLRAQGLDHAIRDRRLWLVAAAATLLTIGLLVAYPLLTGTGSPP